MKESVILLPGSIDMPCWYYEKKDLKTTPSIKDGITCETESRYRKEGVRFIMQCGTAMGLGHQTMATGIVYFHRFYMFHSFKTFPRFVTACCCLFLAGKVEETPKKCKDIIKTARSLLSDDKYYSFGDNPREEVMTLERILLQTIKFDLQVEHPYSFLVRYAKCLIGDQTKLQKMVQMAWNFVNDSLSTTVCLQWEPEIIAVALIHLASKLSKFSVVNWVGRKQHHLRWWDMFISDVTMEILEDICHQVLDLYQPNNQAEVNSPPQQPSSKISPMRRPSPSPPANPPLATTAVTTTTYAATTSTNTVTIPEPPAEEKLEGNPIPKLVPPTPMQYTYQTAYGPLYTHGTQFSQVQAPQSNVQQPPIYSQSFAPSPLTSTQPPTHLPSVIDNTYYSDSYYKSYYPMPPP